MNILQRVKQVMAINLLMEGNSIRSVERVTGIHRDTIMRLAVRVGENGQQLHDEHMKGFHSKYIQCDEIWSYVGKKQGRLSDEKRRTLAIGDQYIYVGLGSQSKLIPAYHVGKRDSINTNLFMGKLKYHLNGNGRQISTDGWGAYPDSINWHFRRDVDYAQQIKSYASDPEMVGRYSTPKVSKVVSTVVCGNPDERHFSTSYVVRQKLTMRMSMRRLTRLTNAFSKKLDNLKAAVALHFAYYNFCRVHQSLRVIPAMEAGITDSVLTVYTLIRG